MNQEQFISAIKIAVAQSAMESMESTLKEPPGRQPYKDNVKLSNWFHNLTTADKEMVFKVVEKTVEMTVFGFLCILDGVRAIEDGKNKGKLNLYYNKEEISVHLNDPNEHFLHDLW